jgi:DnaK suppressor protein
MRHDTDRYRRLLLAERAGVLARFKPNPAPTEIGPMDDEEWASVSHDRFVSVHMTNLDYEKLQFIDLALDRLDSGEFGQCAGCNKPISPERLNVIPWACRCVVCQERVAARQGGCDQSVTAA